MTLLAMLSVCIVKGKGGNFYKEIDLSFESHGTNLYGVLTIPNSKDSNNVLAIIVGGSGPTDKDGNQYGVMFPNTYKFLAHSLAEKGITTFRFDKRGVGASASSLDQESKLTFDLYIEDVCSLINYLHKHRDFGKIILIGHSEGALISFVAGKKAKIDGYVAIASPGTPIDQILQKQIKERMPIMAEKTASILSSLKNRQIVDSVPQALTTIFRKSVQPFLISMMDYDPRKEIEAIRAPILIIQGDNDIQVNWEEAKKLSEANPTAKLIRISGMNHVLKICGTSIAENYKSYNSPAVPIANAISSEIKSFLKAKDLL